MLVVNLVNAGRRWTEDTMRIYREDTLFVRERSDYPLLFYFFTVAAEEGEIMWIANCDPPGSRTVNNYYFCQIVTNNFGRRGELCPKLLEFFVHKQIELEG